MGRVARWLKGLFRIQSKENYETEYSVQPNDKIRWSSGPTVMIPPNITPAEAAWLRSFYNEPDDEQKQHARAVAAATAAAADAAVAAAQAAAMVVRLTSCGGNNRVKLAAAKIQTVFRGYLARKALRALKGLVKIQALVRGFLVRKQAATTLHMMQALIRAQESVRAQKARLFINTNRNFPPQFHARKSPGNIKEHPALSVTNGSDENAKIVEVDMGCWPKSRSKRVIRCVLDSGDDSYVSSPFALGVSTTGSKSLAERECGLTLNECNYSTPPKSECAERYPNYMDITKKESFKAKQRSQSAPKQRPERGPIRRLSLHELMESRNSLTGVRMSKLSSRAQEAMNFKNTVIRKIDRSPNFVKG
ncbi:hypothetical protein CASFOL_030878 [Castilleja foliolosa]|uniref:DUF4005 domain-containing protein n=1 Tax=Castilleja foliolosa TaxID=1961234 RepID=A0ABD3C774_9LAMI